MVVVERPFGAASAAAKSLDRTFGSLTTGSGRIRLGFSPDSDATVTLHSDEGIVVPGGITATAIDSGGDVHDRVVRLGAGRGSFRVWSGDGSISITQGTQV